MWTYDEVCGALSFLLDNIYVGFGNTLFKQIIGIPMGTNCAPLVADLFLYCYERDFMLSLSENTQQDVILAFNNTSRYLDDKIILILIKWCLIFILLSYNLIKQILEI
jgi:hypothetical protein